MLFRSTPEQLAALLETFTMSSSRWAGYHLGWVVNLGAQMEAYTVPSLQLASITKEEATDTLGMDCWRCCFTATTEQGSISQMDVRTLLVALEKAGVKCIKTVPSLSTARYFTIPRVK